MATKKCEAGACIEVQQVGTNVRIRSGVTGTTCQATLDEWLAFVDDVVAGRWAGINADAAAEVETAVH